MQTHIRQLKSIVAKRNGSSAEEPKSKNGRKFDFRKYKVRHIAIKLLYLGWNTSGFAAQEDTDETIEAALFAALHKTQLISSRHTSNYHRCGRTDKGVSAFSQIISLDVRTNLKSGKGVITPEDYVGESEACVNESCGDTNREEINYTLILNNVLPEHIRVICWAPVDKDFSARFDCKSRSYRYWFPKGDLDIDRIRIGCSYLLGEHDFRNLCKMDINNGVVNYKRNILSADLIVDSHENVVNESYSMCNLQITGTAFLWHQIRCIVSLLFLIGQHKEKPEIISELLDVDKHPNKPQYCMSADFPLVLFDCAYSESDLNQWIHDSKTLNQLVRHLQSLWTKQAIKTEIIQTMVRHLTEQLLSLEFMSGQKSDIRSQIDTLCMGAKNKVYKPLFERPFCGSYCCQWIIRSFDYRLYHRESRRTTREVK